MTDSSKHSPKNVFYPDPKENIDSTIRRILDKHYSKWHDEILYSWQWSQLGKKYLDPKEVFSPMKDFKELSYNFASYGRESYVASANLYEKERGIFSRQKILILDMLIERPNIGNNHNFTITNMRPDVQLFAKGILKSAKGEWNRLYTE